MGVNTQSGVSPLQGAAESGHTFYPIMIIPPRDYVLFGQVERFVAGVLTPPS